MSKAPRDLTLIAGVIGISGILFGILSVSKGPDNWPVWIWIAGAAMLGFLSGFSSDTAGAEGKAEFAKVAGAVLIPLLGSGIGLLFAKNEKVTETITYNKEGTQIIERITETVSGPLSGMLHPLAILGSFFLAFGLSSILAYRSAVVFRGSGEKREERPPFRGFSL